MTDEKIIKEPKVKYYHKLIVADHSLFHFNLSSTLKFSEEYKNVFEYEANF